MGIPPLHFPLFQCISCIPSCTSVSSGHLSCTHRLCCTALETSGSAGLSPASWGNRNRAISSSMASQTVAVEILYILFLLSGTTVVIIQEEWSQNQRQKESFIHLCLTKKDSVSIQTTVSSRTFPRDPLTQRQHLHHPLPRAQTLSE